MTDNQEHEKQINSQLLPKWATQIDTDLVFRSLLAFFVIVLLVVAANFVTKIRELENISEAINYITDSNAQMQRLVRMEVTGEPSDQLIDDIDVLFVKLSSINHTLLSSNSNNNYRNAIVSWANLKSEIYQARLLGWNATRLLYASETAYYATSRLANELMVHFMHLPTLLSSMQFFILATILCILIGIAIRFFQFVKTIRTKEAQVEKGYIDAPTGLYNRSKCQDLLDREQIKSSLAVFAIYDLNNLKTINDTKGHHAGDVIISGFADALKKSKEESHLKPFIGRYGGDEFLIYFEDATSAEIKKFAEQIDTHVANFNEKNKDVKISFARGRAFAHELPRLGLVGELFDLADKRMYEHKLSHKRFASISQKNTEQETE